MKPSMEARYRRRMVELLRDAACDQYADWRCEAEATALAYAAWTSAAAGDRALARGQYCVALDRERQAADIYAEIVRSLEAV
jgi:hypothetical protein